MKARSFFVKLYTPLGVEVTQWGNLRAAVSAFNARKKDVDQGKARSVEVHAQLDEPLFGQLVELGRYTDD